MTAASTPSRRRPPRPAWFGSLSRAKGRATAPKLERMEVRTATVPDDVTPTLTVDLTEEVRQPTDMSPPSQSDMPSSSEPSPTAPPPILESAPVQSSVPFPIPGSSNPTKFSSSTRASISSSSPLVSSPLRSTHSSSVTSVDDEVPINGAQTPPPPSPPSVVPSPPDVRDDGTIRPRTLSSLGPASSRFTLSIPLFGRKAPASNEVKTTEAPEEIERSASGSSTSTSLAYLIYCVTHEPPKTRRPQPFVVIQDQPNLSGQSLSHLPPWARQMRLSRRLAPQTPSSKQLPQLRRQLRPPRLQVRPGGII